MNTMQTNNINHNSSDQIVLKMPEHFRHYGIILSGVLSLVITFALLFVPFYSHREGKLYYRGSVTSFSPIKALSYEYSDFTSLAILLMLAILITVGVVYFIKAIRNFSVVDTKYVLWVRSLILINSLTSGLYFIGSAFFCAMKNSSADSDERYYTLSYIPLIIMLILSVCFAFLTRGMYQEEETRDDSFAKSAKIEFFIYGLLVSAVTVISSLSNILKVEIWGEEISDIIYLKGFDIFNTYNSMGAGFQLVAFLLFTVLTVTICLFVASLVGFISKSKFFYNITVIEIISASVFSLLIGLFGKYYEIVQKINEDLMNNWIAKMLDMPLSQIVSSKNGIEYHVTSSSYFYFLVVMFIVAVVLFRKPYTRALVGDIPSRGFSRRRGAEGTSVPVQQQASLEMYACEPCPAFAELDSKEEQFKSQTDTIKGHSFGSPSLQQIVKFVVNYARDSRLHLSYTEEDIATFIAGLGATRLTILQGMSGTGKTSLPKIFSEALFANCDIIEIESSWRDKNELLGYFNEFSRTYTPKKFTQALYKAKLNPERITFIVLDEMNLSRIEYYFSDFLSLMENEEDRREIKLLNVGLFRADEDGFYPYLGLKDGHTIKIPNNVWFIGTANRDESTFEISDKVYDRAHTMNFNKRAPKVVSYGEPIPQRYVSAEVFLGLLEDAKNRANFDVSGSALVKEVEELLAPYNISFGNRIANQMETFVSVYCACFEPSESIKNDAIEKILLSKVVSKLEFKSIENKEQLAAQFRKLNLLRCSEFILKLNED